MLSSVSRNKSTIGEMVNLMSVDAQRLMDILTYLNMLWSAPYQISVAIFFLYRTMGISVFAGVGVMLVIFPLNFLIGRRLRVFQVLMLFLLDLSVPILHIILDANKKKMCHAWAVSMACGARLPGKWNGSVFQISSRLSYICMC